MQPGWLPLHSCPPFASWRSFAAGPPERGGKHVSSRPWRRSRGGAGGVQHIARCAGGPSSAAASAAGLRCGRWPSRFLSNERGRAGGATRSKRLVERVRAARPSYGHSLRGRVPCVRRLCSGCVARVAVGYAGTALSDLCPLHASAHHGAVSYLPHRYGGTTQTRLCCILIGRGCGRRAASGNGPSGCA